MNCCICNRKSHLLCTYCKCHICCHCTIPIDVIHLKTNKKQLIFICDNCSRIRVIRELKREIREFIECLSAVKYSFISYYFAKFA
jgi:hypothetical protein